MSAVAVQRRHPQRIELRVPFTCTRELSFGITLRAPRRRIRGRERVRRWGLAFSRLALIIVTLAAPALIVISAPEISRAGTSLLGVYERTPQHDALVSAPRAVLYPRRSVLTVTSPEPPQVATHVVTQGETLLSIAARAGITPQTLAYDNGIVDTAQLRVGQSLVVPPLDAAIYVVQAGDTVDEIASRFAISADKIRSTNRLAADDSDAVEGRLLLLPVPDGRYPGFRLKVSDAPRVLAPRLRWPVDGVITQLFTPGHTGIDIAAPYGSPVLADDAGTVSWVGWRGSGGLAVCVFHDWGLETCAYHNAATFVETGERVVAGQRIAAVGTSGVTTGPHVHWEARTNGALVDPLTYAPQTVRPLQLGGATGMP